MVIKNILSGCALIMVTIIIGCSESAGPSIKGQGEGVVGKLNNIEVENIHGGAHIYYSLTENSDLAYVQAVYSTNSNGEQNNKSSRYSDSITVKGFNNAESHEVTLYACSLDGRKSDPVTVEIQPLTPTFKRVFDSIKARAIFGGVGIEYNNNISEDDLTLYLVKDSLGFIKPIQQEYLEKEEGSVNIYNLESESTNFGFYVKDNFDNYSDTLYSTLKPLYEVELDKSLWSNPKFPTDTWQNYKHYEFEMLWDDATTQYDNSFETGEFDEFPMWFTIDLGQIVKISRAIFYPQPYWE